MNISKDNLLVLIDEFGKSLDFAPDAKHWFEDSVDKKINIDQGRVEFIKDNLDKPFMVYSTDKGKITKTLYEFLRDEVGVLGISPNDDLGLSNRVDLRLPKKEIDLAWVWDRINKAQGSTGKNIVDLGKQLIDHLNILGTGVNAAYPTSFGISIPYLWNPNADSNLQKIVDFLDYHGILHDDRYSKGHWVINVILSKKEGNLEKLRSALKGKSECYRGGLDMSCGYRRFEKSNGSTKDAKTLDYVCSRQSGLELDSELRLMKALKEISLVASKLGYDFKLSVMDGVSGSPHYKDMSVDAFCKKAKSWLRDSTYLSVDYVDGDPGDQYMLCFHDYDDPDVMDECAQFIFEK